MTTETETETMSAAGNGAGASGMTRVSRRGNAQAQAATETTDDSSTQAAPPAKKRGGRRPGAGRKPRAAASVSAALAKFGSDQQVVAMGALWLIADKAGVTIDELQQLCTIAFAKKE